MAKFRGFISIDIGSFQKLIQFGNEIKNSGANVKLVEPENIHITLKFLGDTNEVHIDKIEKIMENAVNDIDSFEIKFKNVGVFPNQNYIKVLWIGIENKDKLEIIAQKIDKDLLKLGFKKEKRGFSAHLTIGRVRSAKNKDNLLQIIEKYKDIEFLNFKVDSIKLKKSELTPKGPIYTTLKDVKI